MTKGVNMYPIKISEDKIKIDFKDRLIRVKDFLIVGVSSLKSFKTFSVFLDKNLHF